RQHDFRVPCSSHDSVTPPTQDHRVAMPLGRRPSPDAYTVPPVSASADTEGWIRRRTLRKFSIASRQAVQSWAFLLGRLYQFEDNYQQLRIRYRRAARPGCFLQPKL